MGEKVAMEAISWPSVIVALGLLAALTYIASLAMYRYKAEDALKIIAAIAGILGVSIGSFGAYFFVRGPIRDAQIAAQEARKVATEAKGEANKLSDKIITAEKYFGLLTGASDSGYSIGNYANKRIGEILKSNQNDQDKLKAIRTFIKSSHKPPEKAPDK